KASFGVCRPVTRAQPGYQQARGARRQQDRCTEEEAGPVRGSHGASGEGASTALGTATCGKGSVDSEITDDPWDRFNRGRSVWSKIREPSRAGLCDKLLPVLLVPMMTVTSL